MLFLVKLVRRCTLSPPPLPLIDPFLFSPSFYAWVYVKFATVFLSVIASVLLVYTRGTEFLENVMLGSQILWSCALQVGSFDAGYGSSIMSRLVRYHVLNTKHTSNTDKIRCSFIEKANCHVCFLLCSGANCIFSCL